MLIIYKFEPIKKKGKGFFLDVICKEHSCVMIIKP